MGWLREVVAAALVLGVSIAQAMAPTPTLAEGGDAAADLLVPQATIMGGFAASVARPPGFGPETKPQGEFIKLIHPASIGAAGLDLFVADSGSGALLRIDTVTQSVARLAPLSRFPGVRIAAGPDGNIYVLRPDRAEVSRFTRDGQLLATYASQFEILRPVDLVVEPALNRVWIADAAGGVFTFHPSGRKSEPLVGRGDGFALPDEGATVLAAAPQGVVGIDARCACLLVFDPDGRVIDRVGEGDLMIPVALAVDQYGRQWVLDRGDRQLKVFDGGALAFSVSAARLGMAEFTAIAIAHQRVYLADGPGGKIGSFVVLQPRRAP